MINYPVNRSSSSDRYEDSFGIKESIFLNIYQNKLFVAFLALLANLFNVYIKHFF